MSTKVTLPVTLEELKKSIPPKCFKKSLLRSTSWMVFDFGLLFACIYWFPYTTPWTLPLYWLATGFIMWCLFVVGHDCGHGSFSNYTWINDVFGHLCHGPLLVPYWPWRLSHHYHHLYHNHRNKDNSHPWPKGEQEAKELFSRFFWPMKLGLGPFLNWPLYIYGYFDGCHFNPWGSLFNEGGKPERVKCAVSTLVVIGYLAAVIFYCNSIIQFVQFYLVPYFIFSWWLFTVTFLQHHSKDSIVYEEGEWSYLKGALQTIDRTYGFGIDHLHHHITDGHVAHHLFFTQIPHYHLKAATNSLKSVLEPKGLYRYESTKNFVYYIFIYLYRYGFHTWRTQSESLSKQTLEVKQETHYN